MSIAILGKKLGMTQVFDDTGARVPVTVLEAGPCVVIQVKRADGADGYNAVQLGFDEKRAKNTSKPLLGHFDRAKASPQRFVREIRYTQPPELKCGDQVTVEAFNEVKKVDVQGTSKGKGFAGWMKRWNFSGQRASHGASLSHRRGGAQGRTYSTSKGVPKGKKLPGHLGHEKVTVKGLVVIKIDADRNLLIVKGPVPGPNGGYVKIRKSLLDR